MCLRLRKKCPPDDAAASGALQPGSTAEADAAETATVPDSDSNMVDMPLGQPSLDEERVRQIVREEFQIFAETPLFSEMMALIFEQWLKDGTFAISNVE